MEFYIHQAKTMVGNFGNNGIHIYNGVIQYMGHD